MSSDAPSQQMVGSFDTGYWSVTVYPYLNDSRVPFDLTTFRGAPVKVMSLGFTDPFGPSSAVLQIPTVSMLEATGAQGTDLWWLQPEMDVDITFTVTDPTLLGVLAERGRPTSLTWEGLTAAENFTSSDSGDSLSLECIGAMRILDYRVAEPLVYHAPYPYEALIAKHFEIANRKHPTRLAPMRVEWPSWWGKKYRYSQQPWYLRPRGVSEGDNWSGMLAREMGRWDKVLSSAVQNFLSAMFTGRGQWSLRLDKGRVPVLWHRDRTIVDDGSQLFIDAVNPGVKLSMSRDHSMTLNAMYGEVQSTQAGTKFTNRRYSNSGGDLRFIPFASKNEVNEYEDIMKRPGAVRHEIFSTFTSGLTPAEAISKAEQHVATNSAASFTGDLTLRGVDPTVRTSSGSYMPFPRHMINAGDSLTIRGLSGKPEGLDFTVTNSSINVESGETQLTLDSKFRDSLTVREVRERGRDSLRPWHLMTVGQYQPNVPDVLVPWSYGQGSGFFPYKSRKMWTTPFRWKGRTRPVPEWLEFPWTELTRQRPPKSPTWGKSYARIGPAQYGGSSNYVKTTQSWNKYRTPKSSNALMLLSQAGTINLFQIAAFDRDGNVKPVRFHVSLWATDAAHARSTPLLKKNYRAGGGTNRRHYRDGEPYPFYEDAWEQYDSDGTLTGWQGNQIAAKAGLIVGFGNHWEKAGYWPYSNRLGTSSERKPTGLFSTEEPISYDLMQSKGAIYDPTRRDRNTLQTHASVTVLIFCDDDPDEPTYFLGRAHRAEYGTS